MGLMLFHILLVVWYYVKDPTVTDLKHLKTVIDLSKLMPKSILGSLKGDNVFYVYTESKSRLSV